ncbi:hypothetical protein D3C75_1289190 [compost metagenome]
MLACPGRADHPFAVQMIRKRNVDGIDIRVGEQLFIAAISRLHAELSGYSAALLKPPAGNRLKHSGL